MKKLVIVLGVILVMMACAVRADTNALARVRVALDTLRRGCSDWESFYFYEPMNFAFVLEGRQPYRSFAAALSNDWQLAIRNIGQIATNQTERYVLLGLGWQYGEGAYIDFLGELSDLRTNDVISAKEFLWARSSSRIELETCLERRYREPQVRMVLEKLQQSVPHVNWGRILSGQAYTNYLDEVAAGCWGQNPPL